MDLGASNCAVIGGRQPDIGIGAQSNARLVERSLEGLWFFGALEDMPGLCYEM